MLTTRHGKHRQIAPELERVGIDLEVLDLDTDVLGTFSGEVERPAPPRQTAVLKARLGMEATGARYGVASEGTLEPHPTLPWVSVDRELVVLVDDDTGLVITGGAVSLTTLAWAATCRPDDDHAALLPPADLPHHAVLVRPNLGPPAPVIKGITSVAGVAAAVDACAANSPDGLARVETDLRAHLCPSRQHAITEAARDLTTRLATACPGCHSPGWGRRETLLGLPCSWCTASVPVPRAALYACPSCELTHQRPLVAPGATADPGQCPHCNP